MDITLNGYPIFINLLVNHIQNNLKIIFALFKATLLSSFFPAL